MGAATTARGLAALRARIAASAPPRPTPDTIVIATWNIRDFGKTPRRPSGDTQSLRYIAEILSRFDLVALFERSGELRENLTDLDVVMDHLGPHWDALMTSPIFDHGGNRERATYVYNRKKVRHHRLASNAQEPRTKLGGDYLAAIQWWRAPFLASFCAGDAELLLLTAHIRWGASASSRLGELTCSRTGSRRSS